MSDLTQDAVVNALKRIKGPDLEGNVVDLGLVSPVLVKDGRVTFSITVPKERAAELEPLRVAAEKVVSELPGVKSVAAVLTSEAPAGGAARPGSAPREHARVTAARQQGGAGDGAHRHTHGHGHAHGPGPAGGQPQVRQAAPGVPGVKHIIAVASGKGGVGKSTTAVNLALGFQTIGLRAGILDADIYGPSIPRLLGLTGRPQTGEGNKLKPMQGYGLRAMSMGFLVDEGVPVVWRGPMVQSALTQMLREVAWGELDVLVIDMPPGTGDAQITIAQQTPLSGAVIVSTPQDLALIDARKGLNMFRQVNVAVLGIVENMSFFVCPKCGERSDIFSHGGAREEAGKMGVPFLGEVPLHMDIRLKSDSGQPVVVSQPGSAHAKVYREIATRAWEELEQGQGARRQTPRIVIE
jgi:ATP-binding protein involved in chromosome partitioning